MDENQLSLYATYMSTLGNQPDLFGIAEYPNASTLQEPTYYDISPEVLEDETFAAMIAEAEKFHLDIPLLVRHAPPPLSPSTNTTILNAQNGNL